MTQIIEENIREYLLCRPDIDSFCENHISFDLQKSSSNQSLFLSQMQREFDSTNSVREKLSMCFLLRKYFASCHLTNSSHLKGVVIEFGVANGVDTFAAYSDGSAAWYESSKAKLIEVNLQNEGKDQLDKLFLTVAEVIKVAQPSVVIPTFPPPGFALISIIGAEGISFGAGASRDMASDALSGPLIRSALEIRQMILA